MAPDSRRADAERQPDVLTAESRQIDCPRLPAVRRRHRMLEQDLSISSRASVNTNADRERDGALVDRAQRDIEPRRRQALDRKLHPFGRA